MHESTRNKASRAAIRSRSSQFRIAVVERWACAHPREHFKTRAARDAANDTATLLRVDPALVRDTAQVRALLAALGRLSDSGVPNAVCVALTGRARNRSRAGLDDGNEHGVLCMATDATLLRRLQAEKHGRSLAQRSRPDASMMLWNPQRSCSGTSQTCSTTEPMSRPSIASARCRSCSSMAGDGN